MTAPGKVATRTNTPYDTASPYLGALPSWVGSRFDQTRVASYDLYDDIYRNVVGTFALIARGTENNPIYIPSGKTIVESCNRYLAVGFDYTVTGSGADTAKAALDTLFRRNKFWSKFTTQKRYGLIRGDALWHIVAYPDRQDIFKRIVMYELDPRTYFPITKLDNADEVVGCHIIQRMIDPTATSNTIVKRQTYLINDDGTIQSTMNYYKEDAWDDRQDPASLKPFQDNVVPLNTNANRGELPFDLVLDARITSLPVYHIRNTRAPNDPFGVSEMSGIERIIAGVNQAISDEEIALALDGLGLYATNSGPPTDDNGNPVNWVLGPGRVVEISEDSTFQRVKGVESLKPAQDHLNWLVKAMRENSATANIAIGVVDATTNLSGIALALQLSPLLAKNAEKETEMMGEYDNLFNDLLHGWMPVYGVYSPSDDTLVSPIVDDPLPVDRAEVLAEVTGLVAENIITILEAQSILKDKLGFEFSFSTLEDFMNQGKALAMTRDPFGARLADELAGAGLDAGNQGATAKPPAKAVNGAVPAPA